MALEQIDEENREKLQGVFRKFDFNSESALGRTMERNTRLKNLLAEDKKDDGLVFDELGVDHLFIDEAHFFKNLETPTKMDRVAAT